MPGPRVIKRGSQNLKASSHPTGFSSPEESVIREEEGCRNLQEPKSERNNPMNIDQGALSAMYNGLKAGTRSRVNQAVKAIVEAKERGGKVVAVVGSGPNIHEGVTTLIAELIHKGLIDGVSTSSAVISHEMAGTLEKVKRFDGQAFGFEPGKLPCDGQFEVSMNDASAEKLPKIIDDFMEELEDYGPNPFKGF
jgi:hypothetical protein